MRQACSEPAIDPLDEAQNTAELRAVLDVILAELPRVLLTRDEAAQALAISPRQLWELTRKGEIPSVRTGETGRSVRYRPESLRRWAERREHRGLTG
jgi:excisionase family DNA binding protein